MRLRVIGVSVLLAAGMGLAPLPAAQAAMPRPMSVATDAGQCAADGGVYVYVAEAGGACVPGGAANGMDALKRGGFSVRTRTDGLICSINGLHPDMCKPGYFDGKFWSYWLWDPGSGTWLFSQLGAPSQSAPGGTIQAWIYGTGERPRQDPGFAPVVPAPAPAPAPAPQTSQQAPAPQGGGDAPAAPAPAPQTSQPGEQPAAQTTATPTPEASASGSTSASPSATSASASSASTATASARASVAVDTPTSGTTPGTPTPTTDDAGSPLATILTLGTLALAAIGGGGWWLLKGRKH